VIATILNAFKVADIRKKLAFTALMLALYRLGRTSPCRVDTQAVKSIQNSLSGNNILGFLNLFSGGGLQRVALMALGIMPYNHRVDHPAAVDVVVRRWKKLSKEGEVGQQRITQYTPLLTVALAPRSRSLRGSSSSPLGTQASR